MAMYDYVTFRYRMPNGANGAKFATKDLECTMDQYKVTRQGRLVRVTTTDQDERPVGDLNYSGWLDIISASGHFRLEFMSGSLCAIQVMDEDKWAQFDPTHCLLS
jgi:hypothetical protein